MSRWPSAEDRFHSYVVDEATGCWVWQRAKSKAGYATFRVAGKQVQAARWSYERYVGPIPPLMEPDHLCRRTSCVNYKHLEAVTRSENIKRSDHRNRRKKACPQGHPYDEKNTYHYRGRRYCRACHGARG